MLTPVDLENRDFRRALRGYDVRDVDEYLDRVTAEFERLFRANAQHRDEIEALKQRIEEYRQIEANMRDTLMMAQDASQQLKGAAAREAGLIVAEAKDTARKIVEEADDRTRAKRSELEELRRREELFRIQFRGLLESYLTALDAQVPPAQPYPSAHVPATSTTPTAGPPQLAHELASLASAVAALREAAASEADD